MRLFRFPYGSSNADALHLVNQLGYTAVGWTAGTLGWEGTRGGQTRRSVVAHVLAQRNEPAGRKDTSRNDVGEEQDQEDAQEEARE